MNLITINTDGLEESIRCILCKNNMKTEFGCDGSCDVDNSILAKICDEISSRITERYRWHDLRKNPDDLPPHGMKVECQHLPNLITDAEELVVFHYFINGNFVYNWDLDTDVRSKTFGQRIYGDIIAWREIEPFEVTE